MIQRWWKIRYQTKWKIVQLQDYRANLLISKDNNFQDELLKNLDCDKKVLQNIMTIKSLSNELHLKFWIVGDMKDSIDGKKWYVLLKHWNMWWELISG